MIWSRLSNDICHNFSSIKHYIQQPHFLISHTLFCGLSAAASALCLGIPPEKTLAFIHLVYLIDQVVAPIFSSVLEPYRHTTLVPLAGQVAHLMISAALANQLCFAMIRMALSSKQILAIGLISLASKSITKMVIDRPTPILQKNIEG